MVELLEEIRLKFPEKSDTLIPRSVFNRESLIWAEGHYLSRRYPGHFKNDNENSSFTKNKISIDELGPEPMLGSTGALVPLLDILNHDDTCNWLDFSLDDGYLCVSTLEDIEKVSKPV